ncbi:hypothetical protein VUR80DRAFT_893 [Thermomyces stellatus]
MVIQLSTRGTADSDNWFLRLSDRATDKNRLRLSVLAGGRPAGLEVPGGDSRIVISMRAGDESFADDLVARKG